MITLVVSSSSHTAHMAFGTTSFGSPLESMDQFLKDLKRGVMTQPVEKVSKSGRAAERPPLWEPMDLAGFPEGWLGDDFRPFVGKRLKRLRTESDRWVRTYQVE